MTPFAFAVLAAATFPAAPADRETPVFEMRTYTTASPEKLDALHARFRDHTVKLFKKHGMTNVGYFVPIDNTENKLVYFLAYPDMAARKAAWDGFLSDPDWKAAYAKSTENGKLVTKIDSLFLTPTDFSPTVTPGKADEPRTFELRTYTATPGNLDGLLARFRDHTVTLFKKHGMTNVAYWVPAEGQPGAGETLVYLLAHDSEDARTKSFGAFRDDPKWTAARTASEEKAGGSLTAKDGVKSVLLKPTDYSPMR